MGGSSLLRRHQPYVSSVAAAAAALLSSWWIGLVEVENEDEGISAGSSRCGAVGKVKSTL